MLSRTAMWSTPKWILPTAPAWVPQQITGSALRASPDIISPLEFQYALAGNPALIYNVVNPNATARDALSPRFSSTQKLDGSVTECAMDPIC